MDMLRRLYIKLYESRSNILIYISVVSVVLIAGYFYLAVTIKFNEVHKCKGVVVPSDKNEITMNYDSCIEENYIEIGKNYSRGDILIKLNKEKIEREINNLSKELKYNMDKLKISRGVISAIEEKEIQVRIDNIIAKIKDLKEQVLENVIKAPYDSVIVSSTYQGVNKGFIPKGQALCKIVSNKRPLIKTMIKTEMIGKILKDQKCLIKVPKTRLKLEGTISKVELAELKNEYIQYGYVMLDKSELKLTIGMQVTVQIIMGENSIKDYFLELFAI